MTDTRPPELDALAAVLRERAFRFVPARESRTLLGLAALDAWPRFAASWGRLPLDAYMADGGRYRRRRHATLSAPAHAVDLRTEPHAPHFQSLEYNRLNGGIERHFEPIEPDALASTPMQSAGRLGLALFQRLHPGRPAHVEAHQFRIEAHAAEPGRPTPEGAHRDGVDFVLVMLVQRRNVASGTTEVFDLGGRALDRFTLAEPGDIALVDDRRALHGVTPIVPLDAAHAGWRDVLVVTYRAR